MYQLVETINITDGTIKNIHYHNERCNASRKELFGCADFIDLTEAIKLPYPPQSGRYKCRILYDANILSIEFSPYAIRKINSLKIVHANDISYAYKFADREALTALSLLKADCDDILIVKNNHITDTSYSNIAFFDGRKWLTPSTPLLAGTKRALLLENNEIHAAAIALRDLKFFTKACLINAMLDLGEVCLPVENIG